MVKAALALVFVFACGSAEAQICSELFRATPNSDELLHRVLAPERDFIPSQTEVLRAARADVLGSPTLSTTIKYWLRRRLAMFELNRARQEDAAIEFNRRKTETDLRAFSIEPRKDFLTVLRNNRPYLSSAVALGLNGAVNYISYRFYGTFDPTIVYVPYIRIFNWRTLPDGVLREMVDPEIARNPLREMPETRAYVANRMALFSPRLRSGADFVYRNGKSYYHTLVLALALVSANPSSIDRFRHPAVPIQSSSARTDLELQMIGDGLTEMTIEQNESTLEKAKAKRETFRKQGNLEKVAIMNSLIHDIEAENETLRNTPHE